MIYFISVSSVTVTSLLYQSLDRFLSFRSSKHHHILSHHLLLPPLIALIPPSFSSRSLAFLTSLPPSILPPLVSHHARLLCFEQSAPPGSTWSHGWLMADWLLAAGPRYSQAADIHFHCSCLSLSFSQRHWSVAHKNSVIFLGCSAEMVVISY